MRPIKFRAWDEDSNFMEYFEDFREWTCLEDAEHFYNKAGDGLIWMQYTGLKDENGKEIYEGDIIEFDGNILLITLGEDYLTLGYETLKYKDKNVIPDIRLYRCGELSRIIGNRFENPELSDESIELKSEEADE